MNRIPNHFIGDKKLSAPNISVLEGIQKENEEKLEALRREFNAKSVLYLEATSQNQEDMCND